MLNENDEHNAIDPIHLGWKNKKKLIPLEKCRVLWFSVEFYTFNSKTVWAT